jgi:ribosomal protein S18 acetylase RimI-like enzyme
MKDLHESAYRAEDAAAVADLLNLAGEAGGGHSGFVATEVDDTVRSVIKDTAADTRLVTDAQGLVAVALVLLPPVGGFRVSLVGAVHPDRHGEGLGRELLAWQLDRAAARHAEVAPDAPWSAQVVSGAADTSTARLSERFGFTVARYFLAMNAPTTPAPVATPSEDVLITPYDRDQEHEVYALHSLAFRDVWGYQERGFEVWAAVTVRSGAFRADLSRVAVVDDTIVGYLLAYEDGTPGRVYIGQIGTSSAWRRRGIATSLLADAMGAAGQAGYTRAALDTDADSPTGAPGVYRQVGFVIDRRVVAYHKPV